jgi:hypothetical protein
VSAVAAAWNALREERRTEPGWHLRQLDPEASCSLFAALHQPGHVPGLIIEADVNAVAAGMRMPRSAGFAVEAALLGHSRSGRVRLTLSLADRAYASVFAILCDDAAETLVSHSDERAAVRAVVDRLHVWQAFMARHGAGGLSQAAVIGLMGELAVLRDHLAPIVGIATAVAAWAGPRGEPNDFALECGFLEVKATMQQAPDRIAVANADQLDPGRGRILLAHRRFREASAGETLPDMVEALRSALAAEAPAALAGLEAALFAAGYVDAHRELYDLRLEPAGLELFETGPDFPHVARLDLRAGVADCRYSIDLAACRSWTVPLAELGSLAGPAHG